MKKFTLLLIAFAFSTFAFAQADFSGTWALNTSKSKLGEQSFAPQKVVITQKGNDMTVETTVWSADKKVLTVNTKIDMQGNEMTIKAVYKMDGPNLVIDQSFGDFGSETQVFDKK